MYHLHGVFFCPEHEANRISDLDPYLHLVQLETRICHLIRRLMKIVCLVLLDSYLCSHDMVTSSCWLDFILKRDLKSKKEIFLKTHLCSSWLSLLASWIHAFEEKASQGLKNFKVPSLVCTHHSISSLIGLDRYWRIKFQTMVLSTFLDDSGA